MASDLDFVEYVCELMQDAGEIRHRKMFGEYAIYCDEKVVALVCDNQLFVKPTEAGRAFLGEPVEAPPYHGAKYYFLVEALDDGDSLSHLIRSTCEELPAPKPKRRKPR